jgi:hypothetical protein
MVRYLLPSVGRDLVLDRRCRECHRANGQVHAATRPRPISDWKVSTIWQRRMKCPWCGRTWTVRSEGVGSGRQRSDRLRGFGVMLYMLGLSYRGVEQVVATLGCRGGKSSIEREVSKPRSIAAWSLGRGRGG